MPTSSEESALGMNRMKREHASAAAVTTLERLRGDLTFYREIVDQLAADPPHDDETLRRLLLDVLAAAVRIYHHYLEITRGEGALWSAARRRGEQQKAGKSYADRERALREQLSSRLPASPAWRLFKAENGYSRWFNLWELRDYMVRICTNLSAVYEDSLVLEDSVEDFLQRKGGRAAEEITTRLWKTATCNLILLIPALQTAVDDLSWISPEQSDHKQQVVQKLRRQGREHQTESKRGKA